MSGKMSQLFDIRNVIGALLGIYGVVLTIAGLAPGLLRERDKRGNGAVANTVDLYFGTEANWWVGLALILVAVVFFTWAALRPVAVVASTSGSSESASP
jgi:heme/copper-type cytochrome/quinol oxidase subunit 2